MVARAARHPTETRGGRHPSWPPTAVRPSPSSTPARPPWRPPRPPSPTSSPRPTCGTCSTTGWSCDADAAGGLTPALRDRMSTLIRYAVDGGADAVLLSCSMYGPVARRGRRLQPVHGPGLRPGACSTHVAAAPPATGRRPRLAGLGGRPTAPHRLRPPDLAEADVDDADRHARRRRRRRSRRPGDLAPLEQLLVDAASDLGRARCDLIVLGPVLPGPGPRRGSRPWPSRCSAHRTWPRRTLAGQLLGSGLRG